MIQNIMKKSIVHEGKLEFLGIKMRAVIILGFPFSEVYS